MGVGFEILSSEFHIVVTELDLTQRLEDFRKVRYTLGLSQNVDFNGLHKFFYFIFPFLNIKQSLNKIHRLF